MQKYCSGMLMVVWKRARCLQTSWKIGFYTSYRNTEVVSMNIVMVYTVAVPVRQSCLVSHVYSHTWSTHLASRPFSLPWWWEVWGAAVVSTVRLSAFGQKKAVKSKHVSTAVHTPHCSFETGAANKLSNLCSWNMPTLTLPNSCSCLPHTII